MTIIDSIRRWFRLRKLRNRPVNEDPIRASDLPLSQTAPGRLWAQIAEGQCPDCRQQQGFYEGPSGGMSTNIECAACGKRFNVTPVLGIAERI